MTSKEIATLTKFIKDAVEFGIEQHEKQCHVESEREEKPETKWGDETFSRKGMRLTWK